MTKSELKYNVEQTGSYFFTSKTMKFFGDTMKNYGVRSTTIDTYTQEKIDCWELYRTIKAELAGSKYWQRILSVYVFGSL